STGASCSDLRCCRPWSASWCRAWCSPTGPVTRGTCWPTRSGSRWGGPSPSVPERSGARVVEVPASLPRHDQLAGTGHHRRVAGALRVDTRRRVHPDRLGVRTVGLDQPADLGAQHESVEWHTLGRVGHCLVPGGPAAPWSHDARSGASRLRLAPAHALVIAVHKHFGGEMGKVAWGFTCSIDGFIAGPGHDMSWLSASEPSADGATERMAAAVGVIISGRAGYDAAQAQRDERDEMTSQAYGGAWSGTEI